MLSNKAVILNKFKSMANKISPSYVDDNLTNSQQTTAHHIIRSESSPPPMSSYKNKSPSPEPSPEPAPVLIISDEDNKIEKIIPPLPVTSQAFSSESSHDDEDEIDEDDCSQPPQSPLPSSSRSSSYKDHSHLAISRGKIDTSAFIFTTASAKKNPPFPVILHRILCRAEFHGIIDWLPHGRSWRVVDPHALEQIVIPKFFRHTRYASFLRQVNGWGFRRVSSGRDLNSYYHELFLRGLPHLCLKMTRFGKQKKNRTDQPTKEPNFYKISEENPLPDYPFAMTSAETVSSATPADIDCYADNQKAMALQQHAELQHEPIQALSRRVQIARHQQALAASSLLDSLPIIHRPAIRHHRPSIAAAAAMPEGLPTRSIPHQLSQAPFSVDHIMGDIANLQAQLSFVSQLQRQLPQTLPASSYEHRHQPPAYTSPLEMQASQLREDEEIKQLKRALAMSAAQNQLLKDKLGLRHEKRGDNSKNGHGLNF